MSSLDFWERVIGIFVGLMALLGGPAGWYFRGRQRNAEASKLEADAGVGISNARKLDAETLQVVSTVYQNIIAELRKEVTELNGRVEKMEKELHEARAGLVERDAKITEMQRHIATLEKQIKQKEDKV